MILKFLIQKFSCIKKPGHYVLLKPPETSVTKHAMTPNVDLRQRNFGAGSAGWFVFNHVGSMEIKPSASGESN